MFIAWESFLEESFLRYMCGFHCKQSAPQVPNSGSHLSTLALARAALHGSQQYLLWHNPAKVVARSQSFFTQGAHETVIASNQARIEHFARARHRVAHAQQDAHRKFDQATMSLVGRRYPASRVGRFLRDRDASQPLPSRWLQTIASELVALARQIVPP